MKPQIHQLISLISERKTYDEVKQFAFAINPAWRSSTWERGLRGAKDKVRIIYKDLPRKSPIVAYEPFEGYKSLRSEDLTLKSSVDNEVESLNNHLKRILEETPPTWNNSDRIKEIQKAIKSKYIESKKLILNKYERTSNKI